MTTAEPVTRQRLIANAYRTLGLSASASQSAIDQAARRMRLWPDPTRIPPTPWDTPYLGPLARSRTDIERAVARLHQPVSRLEERLLWFHANQPPSASPPSSPDPDDSTLLPAQQHERALTALGEALAETVSISCVSQWRYALDRFEELAASPNSSAWLEQMEGKGDYEKRATKEEIDVALASLPGALASGVAERAYSALMDGQSDLASRMGHLLGERTASAAAKEGLVLLLNRIEDTLDARCGELDRDLRGFLRTDHQNPAPYFAANLSPSQQADETYSRTIHPLLLAATELSKDDNERCVRMRSKTAAVLILLALGWEWSNRMIAAETTLLTALEQLEGTQGHAEARIALERVAPLAARARENARLAEKQEATQKLESAQAVEQPSEKPKIGKDAAVKVGFLSRIYRRLTRAYRVFLIVLFGSVAVVWACVGIGRLFSSTPSTPAPTPVHPSDPFADLLLQIPAATTNPTTQTSAFGEASREQ